MKIVFSRWVGVDSVAPAPDYLDRQNADCGGASRFYRRGVAFSVSKPARTVSIALWRISAMPTRT